MSPPNLQRWHELLHRRKARVVGLLVACVVVVALQLALLDWYVEDAAISFAYARNLAGGEGLVPFAGGERVEGYSNPLWVFLLAPGYLLGVEGFTSSKVLAALLSAGTVPLVWAIAREARPGGGEGVPLIAVAVLATSAQFAIWNASGLENPLFSFLLALGIWRTLVEAREGGWPWGALAFFGVAITRPEGVLYAALGGAWYLLLTLVGRRGPGAAGKWLLTFALPFGLYHLLRYWYFAWELPNTYYAKSNRHLRGVFAWHARCWSYTRGWAHELWHGYLLPVYVLGLLGSRGRRGWTALVAVVLLGGVLLYPATEFLSQQPFWPRLPSPSHWVVVRVGVLVSALLLLPVLAVGRRGWRTLVLCWGVAVLGLFFSWWSTGDWMKGYRWMSLIVVPLSVIFAVGVGELADWMLRLREGRPWRVASWAVALVVAALVLPPNLRHLVEFRADPETSPQDVRRRVLYMDAARDRLHMERVVNFDVDMGATLYWARPDTEVMDVAGLVDVSIAHHEYQRRFVNEYLFRERRPHFVHSHGGWARTSRIQTFPDWRETYVEIPGYPVSPTTLHIGNHVRRDLILGSAWTGPTDRRVRFESGVVLEGWTMPAPEVGAGRHAYLEVGISGPERMQDFRLFAFLADAGGRVATWDLPPAYDWIPPHGWKEGEVFQGRYSVPVPEGLPPGLYDLGFFMVLRSGQVVSPEAGGVPDGVVVGDHAVARGEVRFPWVVRVLPWEQVETLAREEVVRSVAMAGDGACVDAGLVLRRARRRMTRQDDWEERWSPMGRGAIASCWARQAGQEASRARAVEMLEKARRYDHRNPDLRRVRRDIVRDLEADGAAARATGDWERAFWLYRDVLRIDPSRSWSRRRAEEARDRRLGLLP